MKKTTKILTATLALLLVIPMLFLFASCNNKDKGEETGTAGTVSSDASLPGLEVKDLEQAEIKILWPEIHGDGHYVHNEIAVTDTPADNLDEAVVMRNLAVESAYNVSIVAETAFISDIPKTVRDEYMLGTSTYSAIVSAINNSNMIAAAQEGTLADFNELDYYSESDQPWWNHELMQDLSFANARYFAAGDIIYSDDFYPYCTYVNTKVSQDNGITENYYELVKNYQWTLEKFHTMAADVAIEMNGEGDAWADYVTHGAVINANFFKAAYYSAGKGMIELDSKGYPVWQMTMERTQNILEKAISVTHNNNACLFSDSLDGNHAENEISLFNANKTLFLVEELIISERITRSDNKADFQVLPYPLYDSNSEYISVLNDAAVLAVPVMVGNKDDVSLVLSAMSRESVNTLTPAFFENVLTYRYMQNPESMATLEIILDSTVAPDAATLQKWGGNFMNEFKSLAVEGSTDFSSLYSGSIGTAMADLEAYCVLLDQYYAKH